jgi:tripartite-type tricarboxylate transporter receptor subunit TctC
MTNANAFAARRRRLIGSLGASALAIAVPCRAQSGPVAGWPARPVRVVVPGPAGSQTDLFARFVCEHFARGFTRLPVRIPT